LGIKKFQTQVRGLLQMSFRKNKILMNYLKNSAVLLGIALFLSSCTAQRSSLNSGVVLVKTRFYDTTTHQYVPAPMFRDNTMWYKDSLVIQEIDHIYQYTDENKIVTWKVVVERYKFLDLRTREIFEYHTFSDTAKLIKKCAYNDSNCIKECWKFWTDYDNMKNGNLTQLSDTLINKVQYKRVITVQNIETEKGLLEFTKVAYLQCDIKNPIITFNPVFSKKTGCALVRIDEINQPKIYTDTRTELEYFQRKFTIEEERVFASWERNAKEYSKKQ
jgi:hypothetical protein